MHFCFTYACCRSTLSHLFVWPINVRGLQTLSILLMFLIVSHHPYEPHMFPSAIHTIVRSCSWLHDAGTVQIHIHVMITLTWDMMLCNPVCISILMEPLYHTSWHHVSEDNSNCSHYFKNFKSGIPPKWLYWAIISVLAHSGMTGSVRWNEYLKVEIVMQHRASHLVMYFPVQLCIDYWGKLKRHNIKNLLLTDICIIMVCDKDKMTSNWGCLCAVWCSK